jgi:PAS domain S-box-containing protein
MVRQGLAPVLADTVPYITFFPVVAFSAAFGGFGPGVLTTVLGGFATVYLVILPGQSQALHNLAEGLGLLLYLGVGTLISYLIHALQAERLGVREAAERLNLAQAVAGLGIWDWDVRTGAVAWSPELYETAGLQPDAIEPSFERWLASVHPDDRERAVTAARDALQNGQLVVDELRVLWPDGTVRWLLTRGRVFRDSAGAPVRMVGVTLDITDRKYNEEAVRNLNEELRKTNAELEQYAYAASHDLQEPLRMVTLYSQLLTRRYRDKLDDEAGVYFEYIQSGARRMHSLITDLLSYSRLIAEIERHFVAVDINAVVHEIEESSSVALAESGGSLTYQSLPAVRADFGALVAVFQNLVANAIKYRRPNEPPRIRISAERQNQEWRFAFQDNGIGIKPEYHERIFGIFKRLHGRTIPGTGMGLAICKKVIEQHGGRIWVESEEGTGATFFFTLPDRS